VVDVLIRIAFPRLHSQEL